MPADFADIADICACACTTRGSFACRAWRAAVQLRPPHPQDAWRVVSLHTKFTSASSTEARNTLLSLCHPPPPSLFCPVSLSSFFPRVLSPFLSRSFSPSLSLSFSRSLSFMHMFVHKSLICDSPLAYTLFLSLSLLHTHTHTLTVSLKHSHTHTRTHTHTHTHEMN